VIANLPNLSAGLSMGFSAILIPQLQRPGSDIPITLEQGSWIASLFVIGDLLGCTIGGPLAERFGRRIAVLLDCLPLAIGWILTWQAVTLEHLYIARAITGVGIGAGVPIVSMYVREISTPEVRGSLVILMPAAANSGNLFMYVFGYFLHWRDTCIPGSLIPFVPFLLFTLLPESPAWLMKRGRTEEAISNVMLLRGVDRKLAETIIQADAQASHQDETKPNSVGFVKTLSDLCSLTVILPMLLLVFLFFTQSFSGSNMVSYYTVTIFQMAKIPIDENIAAILVAAQYVIGYTMSSFTVTRFGRRTLLFVSLLIMCLANIAAGLALMLYSESPTPGDVVQIEESLAADDLEIHVGHDLTTTNLTTVTDNESVSPENSWINIIPMVSCILITFGYGCGLGPVPFILFGELFPESVRGSASSITAFLRSITVFLSIKVFPNLLDWFGIGGSFISCAIVCSAALVLSYWTVPETKGMDTSDLENIYRKKPSRGLEAQESILTTATDISFQENSDLSDQEK